MSFVLNHRAQPWAIVLRAYSPEAAVLKAHGPGATV